jgi:hypothetical protein
MPGHSIPTTLISLQVEVCAQQYDSKTELTEWPLGCLCFMLEAEYRLPSLSNIDLKELKDKRGLKKLKLTRLTWEWCLLRDLSRQSLWYLLRTNIREYLNN